MDGIERRKMHAEAPLPRKKKVAWVRPSHDRILEGAEKAFAENGYGETSLRMLMAAAGVSTTAFYARYPSKEAVLQALVERMLGKLAEDAATTLPQAKNVEEAFAAGVDVLVKALRPHKVVTRLALTEAVAYPEARAALHTAYAGLAELLAAQVALVKKAEIEDPKAIAWVFIGAMKVQLERWAVFEELDDKQFATACKNAARAMLPLVRRRQS